PAVPTWATWRQTPTVVLYPPHLKKTATIALVVGTILFAINQLDVVVRGDATVVVWVKVAVTYLVPYFVSNAGVLVASHRTSSAGGQ
ncbi:MAG TPA: nitrate/nitrite transporter NrtS, partial [Acidimicrobiales bacterium]|nr:nitrate/nitrite transporter NrtS [Acidimicrobiales bacterium]